MVSGHHQGSRSNLNGARYRFPDCDDRRICLSERSRIQHLFLNEYKKEKIKAFKKYGLPFAVMTGVFFLTATLTHAQGVDPVVLEPINPANILPDNITGTQMGVLPQINEQFGVPQFKKLADNFNYVADKIRSIVDFFSNFKYNVVQYSTDLLTWIYQFISSMVLHMPSYLFGSTWFKHTSLVFGGMSAGLVLIFSMMEGLKRMLPKKKNVTDLLEMSKRLPFAVAAAGIAPFLFEQGFNLLNKLTNSIIKIGKEQMNHGILSMDMSSISGMEVFAYIGFDIALIAMMVPVLLQNFRRWFDLIMLGVIAPVALSCWVFKEHRHYFHTWWGGVKKLSLVQLSYAVFLTVIGIFMFGVKAPENSMEMFLKLGIIIGGLWRMTEPPSILKKHLDTGKDVKGVYKGFKSAIDPLNIKKGFGLGTKKTAPKPPIPKK